MSSEFSNLSNSFPNKQLGANGSAIEQLGANGSANKRLE